MTRTTTIARTTTFALPRLDAGRDAAPPSERERIRDITLRIKAAERDVRNGFGILEHQDALGAAFFLLAAGTFVASGALYLAGILPAWACIVIGALATSVLREIEHDLIHNLYFRTKTRLQNAMMAAVWPFLGNLPHPWFRRKMHLLHHRTSGQVEDFEERLIGNGMPFGWKKILAMIEPGLAMLVRKEELESIPFYDKREVQRAMFPVTWTHMTVWFGFLLGHLAAGIAGLFGAELPASALSALGVIDVLAIVWVLPNVLRQVCLQILSSSMHYYGDVEGRLEETQVMNAWYLFPLNLFSFNFGSTHGIHHFVVSQPFYIRQMVAAKAHEAFRDHGIRFNDMGTIRRGNRYRAAPDAANA